MTDRAASIERSHPEGGGRTRPDRRAPARAGDSAPVASLQQALGNRALGQLLASRGAALQPKLRVGEPDDAFEREADRVAEAVTSGSPSAVPGISQVPSQGLGGGVRRCERCGGVEEDGEETGATGDPVQRKCSCAEEEDDDLLQGDLLQGKLAGEPGRAPRVGPGLAARIAGLRGGGAPLPTALRADFEPRFGQDFGAVRLHTGATAERSAADLKARAFTVGNDVVFGAGEYAPESAAGRRLLAHELTHVVQQTPFVARRAPLVQRAPTEGEAASEPATSTGEAASEPATAPGEAPADPASDPAADPGSAAAAQAGTAPAGTWIVDDQAESVGAGQMKKGEFLARLRPPVEAAAAKGGSTDAASLVDSSFAYYQGQDAARLNRDLAEVAPAGGAVGAADLIPLIADRVAAAAAPASAGESAAGAGNPPAEQATGALTGMLLAHEKVHAGDAGTVLASRTGEASRGGRSGLMSVVAGAARSLRGALTGSEEDEGEVSVGSPLLLLLGCKPSCPEPASPPKLSKVTVSGPDTGLPCGDFAWGVKWKLDNATAKGGWVVQKVETTFDVKDCNGDPVDIKTLTNGATDPASWPLWEAWEIDRCSRTTGKGTDDSFTQCLFNAPPNMTCGANTSSVKTKGSIQIKGTPEFFDGLSLPGSFRATGKPPTGSLPTTRTDPGLTGGTGAIDHAATATWNCCEGNDKGTHVTTK